MRVGELMTRGQLSEEEWAAMGLADRLHFLRAPFAVRLEESIQEAARKMRGHGLRLLPVVDGDGDVVGFLTDADISAAKDPDRPEESGALAALSQAWVHELMTPNPTTVDVDADVEEAAGLLLEGGFRHLPVLDAGQRLIGMISERDLRTALGTSLADWGAMDTQRLEEVIQNVMRPEPVFVRSSNRLLDILDVFTDERIGAVPVLDENDVLVGILSYVDILTWIRRQAKVRGLAPGRGARAAATPLH